MSQDTREGLGIHAAGQGMGGKGMAKIMKADAGQSCLFQQYLQMFVGSIRIRWFLGLERIWEDPLGIGSLLSLGQQL